MPRKMKESGVEWLGQIPEGWEIKRFKYVAKSLRKGNGITKDEVFENGDLPCVRYGEIYSKYKFAIERCVSKTKKDVVTDPVLVSAGDILFACTGELVEEIGKNILYKGKETCVAGGDIMVASHDQNPAFLNYYLNCHSSQFQKSRNKTKLKVVHAKTSDIENLLVQIPTLPEQEQIAAFLDERCAKIDGMIAEAKTSIEDYKKWKQSIIFEAVTGKHEKNLKPSGVDWIGDVPEGWKVCKVLHALSMPITDGPHTTPELYDDGIPFVSAEAVSAGNGHIDFNHIRGYISEAFYRECSEKYVPALDDIYMIKSGATTGKVAIVDTDRIFTIWSPLAVFRSDKDKTYPKFLFYFLQSPIFQKQVELAWSFGTQQNIGMRMLEGLKIVLPPLLDQRRIAAFLDEKCAAIDKLLGEKEALIADLEAYKKALIFETVTGKREVA